MKRDLNAHGYSIIISWLATAMSLAEMDGKNLRPYIDLLKKLDSYSRIIEESDVDKIIELYAMNQDVRDFKSFVREKTIRIIKEEELEVPEHHELLMKAIMSVEE